VQAEAIRGLDGDAAPPTDALLRAAKPRVLIGAAALLELLLDHLIYARAYFRCFEPVVLPSPGRP
jgi:hypothetical protein